MIIRILLILYVLFAVRGLFVRRRRRELGPREFVLWLILWVAIGIAVAFPDTTTLVAEKLGIGRGLDLLLVLAVVALFYVLFRVIARLEQLERDLTTVVREIAIRSAREAGQPERRRSDEQPASRLEGDA
jgi:hypothetical protein